MNVPIFMSYMTCPMSINFSFFFRSTSHKLSFQLAHIHTFQPGSDKNVCTFTENLRQNVEFSAVRSNMSIKNRNEYVRLLLLHITHRKDINDNLHNASNVPYFPHQKVSPVFMWQYSFVSLAFAIFYDPVHYSLSDHFPELFNTLSHKMTPKPVHMDKDRAL